MAHKGFYIDVENVEQTIREIGLFEIQKKENIRKLVKKTARKVVKEARKRFKFNSPDTKASIKAKYFNYGLMATVKPRLPKGWKAHWFEYGTKERYTKSGKYTGEMQGKPFMGPAEEVVRPEYLAELIKEVKK
ncbi:hypothetical protein [Caloranaerobacter ferrireducens]|uniref:hypothetical protein n=1 Tax=Caloranaerobacter ferrireducens TaxID=1323370 RepID=UPI00084DA3FC|nr:hypothetical protein [Caloranaerobacter ferrireducens]